jgi:hypothetical protein
MALRNLLKKLIVNFLTHMMKIVSSSVTDVQNGLHLVHKITASGLEWMRVD